MIATHSQSGIMGHHAVRILKERAHLNLVKGLLTIEGGCSLPPPACPPRRVRTPLVEGDYANVSERAMILVRASSRT